MVLKFSIQLLFIISLAPLSHQRELSWVNRRHGSPERIHLTERGPLQPRTPTFPSAPTQRPLSLSPATTKTKTPSPGPIPTKDLPNCNVQGTPSKILTSYLWGSVHASDVLACQSACMAVSECESYSFQAHAPKRSKNCVFYHTIFDGEEIYGSVIPSTTSGIFFSDKYPRDGSNFCYGITNVVVTGS